MKSLLRKLVTALCIAAVVPVFVPTVGCGKDESLEDRKANYNKEMEDTMRSNTKRKDIEEELAEDRAAAERAQQ